MEVMDAAVSVTNEKETFLNTWDQEYKTTAKVLRAYPAGKDDLKPAAQCRTAGELAGVFVGEHSGILDGVVKGKIDWANLPTPPATVKDAAVQFDREYARLQKAVRAMSEAEWNSEIDWMVAPRQPGKVRRADVLWAIVHDMIHHRGQFSIYLRMAGGKLPSIYGPTADEPWM
jgi:uncharacterized damage-inducible protein DinB